MSRIIFRLPDIGEGIAEAEIVAWHVAVGDWVEEDKPLADVMTDKATVEMESPATGRIVELGGEVGSRLAIGAPLVVIETGDGDGSERGNDEHASSLPPPPRIVPDREDRPAAAPLLRVLASPAVRARARDLGIDLAVVRPGPDGRVRHGDLDRYVAWSGGGHGAAGKARADEVVKVAGLRRRIAENMAASKRHIPHFSYVEEIDVTALESMRADLNGEDDTRPRLTLLPFLVTAICRVIPDFPMINARYDDEAEVVTRHGAVHMGIATQTPQGLMVPVLRNAQDKNLWQLAREIARLAEDARSGVIARQDLIGSTLTITSLGALGGVATTPVINRPEVAIIGPNRIVERPMFVPDGLGGERVAKRKLMNLSISCDHRVVDGWDAASFVQAVKNLLERPARLLAP
ncbi:branched-chain alpha-keto acid dehydrogenase subunit E2 [Novosphingobium nitrogenifigens DSM 19370]|uniref:Dihydrolipoamide acetyltransferase component of pyruvate dehydrogenase complex n=1 Tax=Novosphingobium nitrogenifigens DSM 19370 TaxID=983920 RepID=F1Z9S8_9SPHN|nr:dihydrolipoamide acetyltransferase family protein [Novosphingobium nitrogenifigens]EGD58664.1 branched-chain alpha-keto acid dehydrogenase subunit E2 [Novosphingobium nitrogenifigens DSM 19370]